MPSVASLVPFLELSGLLNKINITRGNDNKKQLLANFIKKWREFHTKIHDSDPNTTDSFYPAMRLLLPQLEKERVAYGIKEHTLAKYYIEIMGLGKDSPAAQKLLHYKAPKNAKADAGDFASVAFFVLQHRCPVKGTLTIEEVNECLDGIALNNTLKNKDEVKKNLVHLLRHMSALEQKWLIRMIMKELKVGLSQQSILSVFHSDAEDLFNVTSSLQKVCTTLNDPSVRMHEIEVSLFTPFRPMLGERGSPEQVEKLMDNKAYIIETKFDGERMQLHMDGDDFKFFSRGGNDYTSTFGNNRWTGNFVPHIIDSFKPSVQSCILDGEMVGYNTETNSIGSKGENFDIKSLNIDGYQPCFCAFDILLLNGKVLSNLPLKERKSILGDVLESEEGRIMVSKCQHANTRQDCIDTLNDAIDRREEGIMVKNPESIYKPNTRRGGWFKIKPEYVGGLMDELDVLVVGGYFGAGHRGGLLSHFLCAVAIPPVSGDKPTLFHSFCRVGSGYSKKELLDFNKKLYKHWVPFEKNRAPVWLQLAPGLKQRPDTYILPENSCILQIKAAEVIASDQFKTQYTLRFPRVEKIRDDKPWYDCMTTTDLNELRQKSEGKLTGRFAEFGEDGEPSKKKRRTVVKQERPSVASQFKATDVSSVTKVSEMLIDKEFCIINGPTAHPKSELEKKIAEFGGSIVQHPGKDTYCVICDKVTVKVKNLMSKGVYDVVHAEWLLKCIEAKRLIPWVPSDMIHMSAATAAAVQQDYDEHGDSYYTDTSPDQLRKVFENISEKGSRVKMTQEDIAETELKYFPNSSQYGLFRLCRVYLDSNRVIGELESHIKDSSLELTGLELRFYGAILSKTLDKDVSHVIVDSHDSSRVVGLRNINKKRQKKFHIICQNWVGACIEAGHTVNERPFEPETPA